jgi:hypothetical protein
LDKARCKPEKLPSPFSSGTTISPSTQADLTFVRSSALAMVGNLRVQSSPERVISFTVPFSIRPPMR